MSDTRLVMKKVAVLGAGVMGAQIAAHMANANVEVVLFDLPAKEGDPNGIVNKALANLLKLEPSPLSTKAKAAYVTAANYGTDLAKLADCDLVIEAISERMDWKQDLYKKVAPHLKADTIFATNTSGLSINALADAMPSALRPNFCGVHFFNPPRYMSLVELIPCKGTRPELLDALESFLVTTLGKGVVRAKDTPNFIANRIGVFSIIATFHHAEKWGLGFDVVDALTGPAIGRAKSATFRTADVVGLDTLNHVVKTMADTLATDPWHMHFKAPAWYQALLEKGALGQKVGAGFYRKVGKDIHVIDLAKQEYRPSKPEMAPELETIMKTRDPAAKFAALRKSDHPQAQFLWGIFRDLFHYTAVHLEGIAENARDVDFAIRWGYGWAMGPFETWQAAGWQQVAQWIEEDIKAGKTLSNAQLPAWVKDGRTGVHTAEGSWAPTSKRYEGRSQLPVYARQIFPETVLGEKPHRYVESAGETVFENEGVRLWTQGDGVAILSFKSKMHAIGLEVLEGVIESCARAEKGFKGLVVWQAEPPFSAGANLSQVAGLLERKEFDKAEAMVKRFQDASMALKFCQVPTVAAVQGLALGGGCEFVMHCGKAVAALETYMGLVEAGVGLIPAGGGCKEFALRAAKDAKGGNIFPFLQQSFMNIAMAQVSKSAEHAKELGYLRQSDTIVFNPAELLHVAKKEALAMSEAGYRPALKARDIPVCGKGGIATLKMMLVNMRVGNFISEHDMAIAERTATAMCGGPVEGGTAVTEDWLLDWERKLFCELLRTPKTQERIGAMLQTGKPLRN